MLDDHTEDIFEARIVGVSAANLFLAAGVLSVSAASDLSLECRTRYENDDDKFHFV